MLRSHTRFYTSRTALRYSRPWSLFRDFGRENFAAMPNLGVLLFTIATASPRHHQKKNQTNTKGRDPNMRCGCETVLQAGDETLGGKRNFIPYGDVIGGIGTEIGRIRRTRVARDVLPAKRGRASLVRTPLWLHATGAVIACVRPEPVDAKIERAIAHRRVASLQQKKQQQTLRGEREREMELRPEYSRRQYGIE